MDFERYFFIVFMWQMYLIYLRKALILVSGLGIFLRVSGWGAIFVYLFFNCCVLAEPLQCGISLGTGRSQRARSPAVFRLSPLHEQNLAEHPFFRAAFVERSSFLSPQHHCQTHRGEKQPGRGRGLRGPAAAARDGHPGLEQPIFVWKCTVVQCYQCNFDLQC